MENYIFGPVISRRLGISLGVDITPFKTCSLDCVYCECGKTTNHTLKRDSFMDKDVVLQELLEFLNSSKRIDYITFSGSGEPTLNKDIGYIIDKIKSMTNIPVAVITNGTLLYDRNVREELIKADLVIPSLDAVSFDIFSKINKPCNELSIDNIIKGLIEFSKMFKNDLQMEIFIAKGINDSEGELQKIYDVLKQINPGKVQLNTLDRPPAYRDIKEVSISFLNDIKKKWKELNVEVVKRVKKRGDINNFSQNFEEELLKTITRRPLTIGDLEQLTSKSKVELYKYIDILKQEKKIKEIIVEDKVFIALYEKEDI